jgi:hypothetical protein
MNEYFFVLFECIAEPESLGASACMCGDGEAALNGG